MDTKDQTQLLQTFLKWLVQHEGHTIVTYYDGEATPEYEGWEGRQELVERFINREQTTK